MCVKGITRTCVKFMSLLGTFRETVHINLKSLGKYEM